ncbi:MAG TPA: tRNA 2-thiouridine(34) synthase MnmA [Anaerolineales bacterium]
MTKVVVAMSGGVDSSVAAALLQQQGYDVAGMMLRLWSESGREESNRCCTPEAMALARRVAAKLDIPFYVVDAKDVFRENVVRYFLDGYGRGQTPNPCLVCNRQIRWTFLLEHALAIGADLMATGHYARLRRREDGSIQLLRAVDRAKDQSYVLHVLDQRKLARASFPVGEYTKTEVRRMAESFGLPTATRHDSQDLCFLAGDDYRNFLRRNASDLMTPGDIVSSEGVVIGEHTGLANYTIGQRKGLGIASGTPLYVLGKDTATNRLRVGSIEQRATQALEADEASWASGKPPQGSFRAEVQIRYTAKEAPAVVEVLENGSRVRVRFETPQRDITPGQAAVFYDGEVVVGGAIIH